jgi:putative ABC transport system ATP-binding protein
VEGGPPLILQLDGVSKVYRSGDFSITALDDATLRIRGGEIVAIMGPSGSGKTTLLTIAGALLRPTYGRVHICGIEVTNMDEAKLAKIRRQKVGFVYQSFAELLDMFGLSHRVHALPKRMSDGEKQRVAIVRALAKDPDLILADEPTANLDANIKQPWWSLTTTASVNLPSVSSGWKTAVSPITTNLATAAS